MVRFLQEHGDNLLPLAPRPTSAWNSSSGRALRVGLCCSAGLLVGFRSWSSAKQCFWRALMALLRGDCLELHQNPVPFVKERPLHVFFAAGYTSSTCISPDLSSSAEGCGVLNLSTVGARPTCPRRGYPSNWVPPYGAFNDYFLIRFCLMRI